MLRLLQLLLLLFPVELRRLTGQATTGPKSFNL
jgi:hypothetical protein